MIIKDDIRFRGLLPEGVYPSETQLKLCDFIAHGIGNATVEARAGTGKTKTIEMMVRFIPKNKKVLILAFNKSIRDELAKRLKKDDFSNVDVMTYHSLGYKLSPILKTVNIDEKKYLKHFNENAINFVDNWNALPLWVQTNYRRNVLKLIDYCRYNLMQSVKEVNKMINKYDVPVFLNENETVVKMLKWGSQNTNTFDYTDLIWLPYECGITSSYKYKYDFIFIDEAQDSSLAQQNLIEICKQRNTRFVSIGDSFQTINSWAGSDTEAFKTFNKKDNVKQFTLNTSFRCCRAIESLVKKYVDDFNVSENNIEGKILYNVNSNLIKPGDMVLCRLTAPLMKLYLKLIKENVPCTIKGNPTTDELFFLLTDKNCPDIVKDIKDCLKQQLINKWELLAKDFNGDLRAVVGDYDILSIYDELIALEAISDDNMSKNEVLSILNKMYIETKENSVVTLSTVHKAKGLESDNVYILCPSLMPSKIADKDWEIESEKNLLYVAYTRAKKCLGFISESEFPTEKEYTGINTLYNCLLKLKEDFENK